MRANSLPLEMHDRQPPTAITDRASDLTQRTDLFKRQNDLALELLTGPARRALDPHADLGQHRPNHRIEAVIDARRICAPSEQKYHIAQPRSAGSADYADVGAGHGLHSRQLHGPVY